MNALTDKNTHPAAGRVIPAERTKMEYKGFYIDDCMYGMITVQYCGDDVVFRSVEDAKQFIDEITEV